MIETKIVRSYTERDEAGQMVLHQNEQPEDEATLAFSLIERWGMVAAMPDGEDSAGRSKLRLASADELVARAFKCANLAFYHARENGLIHHCGSIIENPE